MTRKDGTVIGDGIAKKGIGRNGGGAISINGGTVIGGDGEHGGKGGDATAIGTGKAFGGSGGSGGRYVTGKPSGGRGGRYVYEERSYFKKGEDMSEYNSKVFIEKECERNPKTKDIIYYILKNYPKNKLDELTDKRILNILYLLDWKHCIEYGEQVTDIDWFLDHYYPIPNQD